MNEIEKFEDGWLERQMDKATESVNELTALRKRVKIIEQDNRDLEQQRDEALSNLAMVQEAVKAVEGAGIAAGMERMRAIGGLIRTQDNRCTDQPVFIVQQKQLTYGVDDAYTDLYHWCHRDGEGVADEVLSNRLNNRHRAGKSTGKWEKIGYVEHWEFVTACFTEQGCAAYLNLNRHNLHETRIYADGSFRNEEYKAVRNFLIALAAIASPQEEEVCVWKKLLASGGYKLGCGAGYAGQLSGDTCSNCGKKIKVDN
jgi:hypothetical protein